MIDSHPTHVQFVCNALEGQPLQMSKTKNLATDGRIKKFDDVHQPVKQFVVLFGKDGLSICQKQLRGPFPYVLLRNDIQTTVADSPHEVAFFRLWQQDDLLAQHMGENVTHHVPALVTVVENAPCHPVHRLVITFEEPSYVSLFMFHTLSLQFSN